MIVLYDSNCGFCRWSLGLVLRWDRQRRIRPVALGDEEAVRLLGGMPEAERMESLHVVDGRGAIASGGAALTELARTLPGAGPLAAAGAAMPRATERGYRFFARHRGRLGRLVSARAKRRADRAIAARSGS